jgi:hypothetical protein
MYCSSLDEVLLALGNNEEMKIIFLIPMKVFISYQRALQPFPEIINLEKELFRSLKDHPIMTKLLQTSDYLLFSTNFYEKCFE